MRRLRRLSVLAAFVLVALSVGPGGNATPPCTITWAGPASGSWHLAANWDLNRVPAAGDVACIGAGSTVAHSSGTTTIRTLLSPGTVTLSGGSVNLTGTGADESSAAAFSLSGGELGGAGTLGVTGTLTWTGGSMSDTGTTKIASGATLVREQQNTVFLETGRQLEVVGTLDLRTDRFIVPSGLPAPLIHNLGTVVKSAGAGTATISAALENDGVVRSDSGRLELRGGGGGSLASGDFGAAAPTGTVELGAGTFAFGNGGRLLGGVDISGATLDVAAGANATASGANTFSAGNLGGSGILTVTGTLSWAGGSMREGGTTMIAVGGILVREQENTVFLETGRRLEVLGTLDLRTDRFIVPSGLPAPLIRNLGTVVKSAGAGTATISTALDNDGVVRSQSGTLELRGGGGTLSASGDFGAAAAPGAVQLGAGTFALGNGADLLGGVDLSGATLDVAPGATATASGTNAFSAGNLGGTGTLNVTGTLSWTGGSMREGGTTSIRPGAALVREAENTVFLETGRILEVLGTLDLRTDRFIVPSGLPAPQIHNLGTVVKSAGAGTATISVPLENDGVVRSQSGTLEARAGTGSASGDFGAPAATGTVALGAGTFALADGARLLGGVDVSGATVDVTPGATATASGANVFSSGNLGGTGTLNVTGALTWTGGSMRQAGTTRIQAGGTVVRDQQNTVFLETGRVLEVVGTLDLRTDRFIVPSGLPTPLIRNLGTVVKTAGAGTATISAALENDGAVEAEQGILDLRGGGGTGTASGRFGANGDAGMVSLGSGSFTLGAGATFDDEVDLGGATVLVPAGAEIVVDDTVTQRGGTLGGQGTVRVTGQFFWRGGTHDGLGTTHVAPGGVLTADATCSVFLGNGRRFLNQGTTRLVRQTSISAFGAASVPIENEGALEIDDSIAGPCGDGSGIFSNARLDNTGSIVKLGGTGAAVISADVDNDGEVHATAGTLRLASTSALVQSGSFASGPGALLVMDNGTFVLGTGVSLEGTVEIGGGAQADIPTGITLAVDDELQLDGTLAGGGTLLVNGAMTWTGGSQGAGATVVAPTGTLTINSPFGVFLDEGRTIVNSGAILWAAGEVASFGGTSLLNKGTLEMQGDDDWFGGLFFGEGSLLHNTGTIVKSGGAGTGELSLAVDNDGTVEVRSGTLDLQGPLNYSTVTNSLAGGAFVVRGATLMLPGELSVNAATLILDGPNAQVLQPDFGGGSEDALANLGRNAGAGLLRLENGKTLALHGSLRNLGVVELGSGGELTTDGDYVQAAGRTELAHATSRLVATGAEVEVLGGRLGGIGVIDPRVVASGGEVSPGLSATGTLAVGSYAAGAGSRLAVQVAGTPASGAFDRVVVSGAGALGGTLRISTAGFTPVAGDVYPIVTASPSTGTFSAVEGLDLGGDLSYVVDYTATGASLRVVGPPTATPPAAPPAATPPAAEPPVAPLPAPRASTGPRVIDDGAMSVLRGPWRTYGAAGFYGGTFVASSRRGATLIEPGVVTRNLGLLVGTCRRCGVVEVYWNGRLLRRVDLRSRTARRSRLIRMPAFRTLRTGTVTVRVASSGRPVRVDGLVEIAG